MGALIFAYCFAGLCVILPLLLARSVDRRIAEADEHRLAGLRQLAETPWYTYAFGSWALLNGVRAIFLLARGHDRGWAWLGVAAFFAIAVMIHRSLRTRLLDTLGDRGRVERSARYQCRLTASYRFALVGLTGYVGKGAVGYAFLDDTSSTAQILTGVFIALLVIGVVGFLVVRTRMYLAGDDLTPTTP